MTAVVERSRPEAELTRLQLVATRPPVVDEARMTRVVTGQWATLIRLAVLLLGERAAAARNGPPPLVTGRRRS